MSGFFIFLLVLAMAGAALAVVRGLGAFYRDAERIKSGGGDDGLYGVQQNKMMTQRVIFQGIAVLIVVILGALAAS